MTPRRWGGALLVAVAVSGCGTAARYRVPEDRLDRIRLLPPVAGTASSPLRVIRRANGRGSIIESGNKERPIGTAQLVAAVRERQGSGETPVVIEADGQVRYETVVRVMSELQKAGIARVGLSVQVK